MASPLHVACEQGTRHGAANVLETFFLNLLFVTFPFNFLVHTVVLLPIPVRRSLPPRLLPLPLHSRIWSDLLSSHVAHVMHICMCALQALIAFCLSGGVIAYEGVKVYHSPHDVILAQALASPAHAP